MKIKENNEKGITLVALVVTIIILLILAGIGINVLRGENGLIHMSIEASKEHIKANYAEAIELIKGRLQIDKTMGNLSTKEVMDKCEEELRKNALKYENFKVSRIRN